MDEQVFVEVTGHLWGMLFRKLLHPNTLRFLSTAFPTITKQVKAKQQTKQQNQCVITCIECRDYEIHKNTYYTIACSRKCSRSCPTVLSIWLFVFVFVVYSFCSCINLLCLYYPKGFGIMQATFPYKNTPFHVPVLSVNAPSMPKLGPLAYDHPIHLEAPVPEPELKKTGFSAGFSYWKTDRKDRN